MVSREHVVLINIKHRLNVRGFTLLEMLIAMSLSIMLLSLLFAGVSTTQGAWERGEDLINSTDDLRMAENFIRTRLEQTVMLTQEDDRSKSLFEGEEQRAQFVSPLMTYVGYSGLYIQELKLDKDKLMLSWKPYRTDTEQAGQTGEKVILQHVSKVAFSYFGNKTRNPRDPSEWLSEWSMEWGSPSLVRLSFYYLDEPAPSIIAPLTQSSGGM